MWLVVFGRRLADFDGFSVAPGRFVAEDATVIVLGRYTGTSKANGQPLNAQFAHVSTIRDGLVVDFQQYTDTAQYQRLANSA